jgi:hypothetical protein
MKVAFGLMLSVLRGIRSFMPATLSALGSWSKISSSGLSRANGRVITRCSRLLSQALIRKLPPCGVERNTTRRTKGRGLKKRLRSRAARASGETRSRSGGTVNRLSQKTVPLSTAVSLVSRPPWL